MIWFERLWRRKKLEEELEKELRFHLNQHAADLIARGHDPEEARRRARLALGGPEQVKELCRDACFEGPCGANRQRISLRDPGKLT